MNYGFISGKNNSKGEWNVEFWILWNHLGQLPSEVGSKLRHVGWEGNKIASAIFIFFTGNFSAEQWAVENYICICWSFCLHSGFIFGVLWKLDCIKMFLYIFGCWATLKVLILVTGRLTTVVVVVHITLNLFFFFCSIWAF